MIDLFHWLLAPWESGIDRRAFAEIVMVGVSGGALGCWIVLYRLSYSAEALAHSLLPGLVLAVLAGLPLILGGAAGMFLAALGIAAASRLPGIERDTAVAVVVTPVLGLGALLALSPETPTGLGELLFGDVLGVTDGDLRAAVALSLILLSTLFLLHGRLLAVGFDRAGARALGVAAGAVDSVLLVLIGAALLVAVQGLGSLLVVAVLVGPAATARALTKRLSSMMVVAAAVAVATGVLGIYLSYYADIAAGASIAALVVLAHQGAMLTGRGRIAQ